jgi:hypothetical protein
LNTIEEVMKIKKGIGIMGFSFMGSDILGDSLEEFCHKGLQ